MVILHDVLFESWLRGSPERRRVLGRITRALFDGDTASTALGFQELRQLDSAARWTWGRVPLGRVEGDFE